MMKDGLLNFCKECVKERVRDYQDRNAEEIRKKDRERYKRKKEKPGYREKENARRRKWRTPEKMRAHNVSFRILKENKPASCEICGRTKCKLGAHHPDYREPFRAIWICDLCHSMIHKNLYREKRYA